MNEWTKTKSALLSRCEDPQAFHDVYQPENKDDPWHDGCAEGAQWQGARLTPIIRELLDVIERYSAAADEFAKEHSLCTNPHKLALMDALAFERDSLRKLTDGL